MGDLPRLGIKGRQRSANCTKLCYAYVRHSNKGDAVEFLPSALIVLSSAVTVRFGNN